MKTPARTLAEINKSKRLEARVLGEISTGGAKTTDQLLRRLDYHSSLESPNLGYLEARVLCAQAAAKIRELR